MARTDYSLLTMNSGKGVGDAATLDIRSDFSRS